MHVGGRGEVGRAFTLASWHLYFKGNSIDNCIWVDLIYGGFWWIKVLSVWHLNNYQDLKLDFLTPPSSNPLLSSPLLCFFNNQFLNRTERYTSPSWMGPNSFQVQIIGHTSLLLLLLHLVNLSILPCWHNWVQFQGVVSQTSGLGIRQAATNQELVLFGQVLISYTLKRRLLVFYL
jgi:hypothetical protein